MYTEKGSVIEMQTKRLAEEGGGGGTERSPEVYKDERLPVFVPLFLPSYYIRNNETQYPARNGRNGMADDREKERRRRTTRRKERERKRENLPPVDSCWLESLMQQ